MICFSSVVWLTSCPSNQDQYLWLAVVHHIFIRNQITCNILNYKTTRNSGSHDSGFKCRTYWFDGNLECTFEIILNRNPLSSASDALNTLGWRKLAVRRYYHRCVHIFKSISGLCTPGLNLKSFQETHSYNTRNKNNLRLPKVKRNWGKQGLVYHAAKDWNTLDSKVKSCKTIKEFKSIFYKHF